MVFVTWTVRLAAFVFLLAFAIKNTEPVALRFYFELVWQMPLIVLLLAFFAAGAVLGVTATLTTLLRQRREIARLRRAARSERAASPEPPAAGAGG